MISVVIPLYNKEKQIAATLQSVLQQTFQDFEIVVVNDGSTDGSVAAAESVVDSRIRIIHQENAGVSVARNKGIEEAKYELIAFLDADDRWKTEYLQTQYELTQKYPDCSVFACNYEFVHADGSVHPTIVRKLPFEGQDGILSNYFEVAGCSHPPISSISIMVRKVAIQAVGGFPVGIKSGEDLLTWARLACHGKIAYSRRQLALFMLNRESSGVPKRKPEGSDYIEREMLKLNKGDGQNIKRYVASYLAGKGMHAHECGLRELAIKCIWKSICLSPENVKNYIKLIILLLPNIVYRTICKNKF